MVSSIFKLYIKVLFIYLFIGSCSGVLWIATRLLTWQSWVRIRVGARRFSLLQNVCGTYPASYSIDTWVLSRRQNGRGVKLSTHRHLVQRLIMSGFILLTLYAFMVWHGKILTLFIYLSAISMKASSKILVFMDVRPCNLVDVYRPVREACFLLSWYNLQFGSHLRMSLASKMQIS